MITLKEIRKIFSQYDEQVKNLSIDSDELYGSLLEDIATLLVEKEKEKIKNEFDAISRLEKETKIDFNDFISRTKGGKLVIHIDDLVAVDEGNIACGNEPNKLVKLLDNLHW